MEWWVYSIKVACTPISLIYGVSLASACRMEVQKLATKLKLRNGSDDCDRIWHVFRDQVVMHIAYYTGHGWGKSLSAHVQKQISVSRKRLDGVS